MTAERKIFISAAIYGILGLVAGFLDVPTHPQYGHGGFKSSLGTAFWAKLELNY